MPFTVPSDLLLLFVCCFVCVGFLVVVICFVVVVCFVCCYSGGRDLFLFFMFDFCLFWWGCWSTNVEFI